MEYMYERRDQLKKAIKKWEAKAFHRDARQILSELRARLDEIEKVIKIMEHEV